MALERHNGDLWKAIDDLTSDAIEILWGSTQNESKLLPSNRDDNSQEKCSLEENSDKGPNLADILSISSISSGRSIQEKPASPDYDQIANTSPLSPTDMVVKHQAVGPIREWNMLVLKRFQVGMQLDHVGFFIL